MIGKRIDKDILSLIYISILTVLALIYGLTTVPDPTQQRKIRLDEERENNLRQLRTNISEYYAQQNHLPTTISDLNENNYYAASEMIKDPQTHQPYEYNVISPVTYTLCATFETDFADKKKTDPDVYHDPEFSHPKGHHCITFSVTPQATPIIQPLWNPKSNTYVPFDKSADPEAFNKNSSAEGTMKTAPARSQY